MQYVFSVFVVKLKYMAKFTGSMTVVTTCDIIVSLSIISGDEDLKSLVAIEAVATICHNHKSLFRKGLGLD